MTVWRLFSLRDGPRVNSSPLLLYSKIAGQKLRLSWKTNIVPAHLTLIKLHSGLISNYTVCTGLLCVDTACHCSRSVCSAFSLRPFGDRSHLSALLQWWHYVVISQTEKLHGFWPLCPLWSPFLSSNPNNLPPPPGSRAEMNFHPSFELAGQCVLF